jgi:hypothetical protein
LGREGVCGIGGGVDEAQRGIEFELRWEFD